MSKSPVRFGLIGFGLFGSHHAAAIANTPGAELIAIAARSQATRDKATEAHPQADVLEDFRELVQRDDIDVVDIVAPNVLHFEMAEAALLAGKHVFLEKPMAVETGHGKRLCELAAEKGLILAVNHELRHSSLWGGVKRLIDEGAIGRPQHVLIELSRFPYRQGSSGWRWDIERVGNWILEEPIHFFDLARWWLTSAGDPVSVYARANSRHDDQPELRDNFSAIVNHEDGSYAVVSQTLAAFEHHVTAKIAGTAGTIWAAWSAADARSDRPRFSLRYGLGDVIEDVEFESSTGELLELADQIAMWVRCVNDGETPVCTGEDGAWSTELCLAAQASVDQSAVITMNGL